MAKFKEPELYTKLSNDHVREAHSRIEKFSKFIQCYAGEDVLDIGCGPGDVTYNVILPMLHPQFSKLVGVDISPDMINFSKKRWLKDERLHFVMMDAAEPDSSKLLQSLPVEKYDKIFSFFALQWISNRSQLAHNLSILLKQGGQAFLVIVVESGVYTVWDSLVKSERWSKYFESVKTPLNGFMHMKNPAAEFKLLLEKCGLKVEVCELEFHQNAFSSNIGSDIEKIEKLRSVDPLVGLLPEDLKDTYMADVLEYTKKIVGPNGAVDYKSLNVICHKY